MDDEDEDEDEDKDDDKWLTMNMNDDDDSDNDVWLLLCELPHWWHVQQRHVNVDLCLLVYLKID